MEQEIPVVIPHFDTKPNYLKLALQSAANFNKTVVHIGDKLNGDLWGNHWDASSVNLDKFQEFQKYYIQMSHYSKQYEMSFWKCIFAMEEWMKLKNIDKAFCLDSDVMTFADYSKDVCPLLPQNCGAVLMTMEKQEDNFAWATSCHFSYWTLDALADFTTFCINAYRNKDIRDKLEAKWQWHLDNNEGGGVCVMTLLYFWAKDNPKVVNFTKVWDGVTADYNFNLAEQYYKNEYQKQSRLKKIIFKEGLPYGYNLRLQKWIRFLCIHCQGEGKCTMSFLNSKYLRRFFYLRWALHRIKSKYFRFSCKKLQKKMSGTA